MYLNEKCASNTSFGIRKLSFYKKKIYIFEHFFQKNKSGIKTNALHFKQSASKLRIG